MASWPVKSIRETFLSHFDLRGYAMLSPSPVISVDDSTPSIDAYLNQFKRTVNDEVQIDSRRSSCYSLRSISMGDDDGVVIDNFYKDPSYHCFSEILGTWASGDYKQEAIKLSWELLTQTYKLPRNKIYIKYFGGNIESGLDPDNESLNIWKRYVPEDRILPSMSEDDFWRAGDTGPCGPSVRILFDIADSEANPTSAANVNNDKFSEIWRFVFVQFTRQENGVLRPLHVSHVITGMNVESLASILQNKRSHYDSDVFTHILEAIQYGACHGTVKYSGKVGSDDSSRVDTAYRLLADHLRTISAAATYCAEHGLQTEYREDLLKHADRRAVVFSHKVLGTDIDRYAIVLNSALRISGFCPTQMDGDKIESTVKDEVKIYKTIRAKDMHGLLIADGNPAVTDSNLHPSLPQRKKEKKEKKEKRNKHKNQRGKQQQQKGPPQLPPVSDKNEENIDAKLDEVDGTVANIGGAEMEIRNRPVGVVYPMRQIDFLGHSTHIIYQDQNGPCPLISICNCLLLKGKINFEPHLTEVPMEHLVHIVLGLVKECLKIKVSYSYVEGLILDVVPTLANGLDIDVKFNRTDGFTSTPGTMLFDCLDIALFHGWLADEEDMADALSHSFETLTWAVKEPHFPNVEKVKEFLKGPQLTPYGLIRLHGDLIENVPSVHYWNMHLSTIIKHNGALYSLVTDEGYLETNVVWQTLNDINGGGSYMTSDFMPIDLELGATPSGEKNHAPLGFVAENYFKRLKGHGMSLEKFILEPGNKFSAQKTLFADGTPLDVAETTRTGRVVALDILRDVISAHSTGHSYNGAYGLRSIFIYNGRAVVCAPFCDECTDATKSNDFETYISDILEIFRIDKVGLPAFFNQLISLLRRPGSFVRPQYFWDCVLTTLALKPPLTRAGLYTGLHRIRHFAPKAVRSNLRAVLSQFGRRSDWRDVICKYGHPLLKHVLSYIRDKSLDVKGDDGGEKGEGSANNDRQYGLFTRSLYSLSIFPRQVNEHGRPKGEGTKEEVEEDQGSKQVEERQKQVGQSEEEVEEWEEPFGLLSDLDLLYSHYLDHHLYLVLEFLLTSSLVSPELWEWVRDILREYDKLEALDPAPWDR